MKTAADPTEKAIGFVTLSDVQTFSAKGMAEDGTVMPEKLPKGYLLRKIGADIQALTDEHIKKIDELLHTKEKDILQV